MPSVARYPSKAYLALLFRGFGEFIPLGILEPSRIIDRVIEIYVDVIRLEATQAALECVHDRVPVGVRPSQSLRGEEYILAVAAQCLAEDGFRLATPIALRRIEIVDPEIDGVPDEIL